MDEVHLPNSNAVHCNIPAVNSAFMKGIRFTFNSFRGMLMYSNCIAITEAVGYGAVEIYCALY